FVAHEKKQISVALAANANDQIEYETYSQDKDQEIVHCQGRATWCDQAVPERLDLEQIRQRAGQRELLTQLRLPTPAEETSADYVLHPTLLAGALQARAGMIESESRLPAALESLRILSPCSQETFAWLRYSPGSQTQDKTANMDIDLCDEQGNVCVQMRGISWQEVSLDMAERVVDEAAFRGSSAAEKKIAVATLALRELSCSWDQQAMTIPVEQKPTGISMAALSVFEPSIPSAGKPLIKLSDAILDLAHQVSSIKLYDHGQGLFSIKISAPVSTTPAREIMASLLQALNQVQQEASVKV